MNTQKKDLLFLHIRDKNSNSYRPIQGMAKKKIAFFDIYNYFVRGSDSELQNKNENKRKTSCARNLKFGLIFFSKF